MSVASARVPVVVACSLIFLLVGVGAGMGVMEYYGDRIKAWYGGRGKEEPPSTQPGGGPTGPPPGMARGPAGPRGGRGGPGGGGGPPPGGGGPPAKAQLATLVTKIDQLTDKPLELHLSAEQRKKIQEAIKGLGEQQELSNDEAQKKLDALLELLKDQKDTLEAAGFRWPGGQRGGPPRRPTDMPNPFTDEQSKKHLESLEKRLATGKAS
jgi:hypothetical protein